MQISEYEGNFQGGKVAWGWILLFKKTNFVKCNSIFSEAILEVGTERQDIEL